MAKTQEQLYREITDRILQALDEGTVPWRRTWIGCDGPLNGVTGKYYRGINVLLLGFTGASLPVYAGYSQWRRLKTVDGERGHVRKGCRGIPVYKALPVSWVELPDGSTQTVDNDAEAGDEGVVRHKTVLKLCGHVFALEQTNLSVDDLPVEVKKKIGADRERSAFEVNRAAREIVDGYLNNNGPSFQHVEQSAWYRPMDDTVNVPKPETFEKPAYYYRTTFHELTHSTGHASRLGRFSPDERQAAFGSDAYSREELVAEIGSAMLCGKCGFYEEVIDVSAGYLDGWRKRISEDPKLIVSAASKAQVACDCILGVDSGDES